MSEPKSRKSIPLSELSAEVLAKKRKSYSLILGISFSLIIAFIALFIYYLVTGSWSTDKLPIGISLAALGALSSMQTKKLKELEKEILNP